MDRREPHPLTLHTTDGERLEAEASAPPRAAMAVVITHPHPLAGGNMRTPVPTTIFNRASTLDCAALRFNFRGVGASTGTHDAGRAERSDVEAAIDAMASLAPGVPILLAGWSFGADVILTSSHSGVAGWFCVAPPLSIVPPDDFEAGKSPLPKILVVPEHDQYRSPPEVQRLTSGWANTRLEVLEAADHFMAGAQGPMGDLFESQIAAMP